MKHLNHNQLVLALDGEMEPDELKLAVEHLAACGDCRGQWEKLQVTSAMVADYQARLYADAHKRDAASRHIYSPAKNAQVGHPAAGNWRWGFAAAAALVLVIGLALMLRSGGSQTVAQEHKPGDNHPNSKAAGEPGQGGARTEINSKTTARPFGAKAAPQDDTSSKTYAKLRPHAKTRAVPNRTAPAAQPDKQLAFTELPFSDASLPLDNATVVRVRLPAAALRQAGVPVEDDSASAMLQAEVVLGLDGLPRGIRLVRNAVPNHAGTN